MVVKHEQEWDALFQGFLKKREAKQQQAYDERELVAWYDEQTSLVMQLVREVAFERAAFFEARTGTKIEVRWPSRAPINVDPEGPCMSFMALCIELREVHMYSH